MKKWFCYLLFNCIILPGVAQINHVDSTVQVITYWDRQEVQNYRITEDKFKIKSNDTTSRETTSYEVRVTVKDSAEKFYTIEWFYQDLKSDSKDETVQKILSIGKDLTVIYKIDEMGSFIEVVNWKEIRDFIRKSTAVIADEYKDVPSMDKLIKQIENMYSSREAIESAGIKDIQQFHSFHGAQYKLGEVLEGIVKTPNIYGPEPFDTRVTVYLDEINFEDNNYIIRSSQEVNTEQLIDATHQYLVNMAKTLKSDPPSKEMLSGLRNETVAASRIHGSGWVMYSQQTVTINIDNVTNIERRTIEIM